MNPATNTNLGSTPGGSLLSTYPKLAALASSPYASMGTPGSSNLHDEERLRAQASSSECYCFHRFHGHEERHLQNIPSQLIQTIAKASSVACVLLHAPLAFKDALLLTCASSTPRILTHSPEVMDATIPPLQNKSRFESLSECLLDFLSRLQVNTLWVKVRQEEGMRQQALLEAGTVWSALEDAELARCVLREAAPPCAVSTSPLPLCITFAGPAPVESCDRMRAILGTVHHDARRRSDGSRVFLSVSPGWKRTRSLRASHGGTGPGPSCWGPVATAFVQRRLAGADCVARAAFGRGRARLTPRANKPPMHCDGAAHGPSSRSR